MPCLVLGTDSVLSAFLLMLTSIFPQNTHTHTFPENRQRTLMSALYIKPRGLPYTIGIEWFSSLEPYSLPDLILRNKVYKTTKKY
jgi:hypothetical protein